MNKLNIDHGHKTTVPPTLPCRSPLRRGAVEALAVVLACLAFSTTTQGQDGDVGNRNTAEGGGALHTYLMNGTATYDDTAIGFETLFFDSTGSGNTALGSMALLGDTTGSDNTATGVEALTLNTTGNDNTATGSFALLNNRSGGSNTAIGSGALSDNTTASFNTAAGFMALHANSTGISNSATGSGALFSNTTANFNTATGVDSLRANTTGESNTATGVDALLNNTSGASNSATGVQALFSNATGSQNYAGGVAALYNNTSGHNNTATGFQALGDNTIGSNNIALGSNAGINLTKGSNNIDIGNVGKAGEANVIRIGTQATQKSTFIAGISGTAVTGSTIVVNSSGKLGVATSSARFKEAIKPMDKASEAILALKPVTFRYKEEVDPDATPQFGLVAEEVEKVAPDLVIHGEEGKPFTVRYEAVNAMLLNEFQKEHRKVQQQEATIAQIKSNAERQEAIIAEQQQEIKTLTASLKEQASQIQKVSAQLEAGRLARPMAASNQ